MFRSIGHSSLELLWVEAITDCMATLFLMSAKATDPVCRSRGDGNGVRSLALPSPYAVHQMLCLLPCTVFLRSTKLPATTEGRLAKRQPLAGTPGRNVDHSLKCTPCVLCLLTPRGDLGSEGRRHQNWTTKDGRHSFSAGCSRSARQDVRAATREPTRSPRRRTVRESLAGRPSPELAGNVPKTGRRAIHFLKRSVSTPSCGPSPMCIHLATSSCVSLRCSSRFPTTSSFRLSHTSLVSLVPLSVFWFVQLAFSLHHLHSTVMTSACRIVDRFAVALVRKVVYPQEPITC